MKKLTSVILMLLVISGTALVCGCTGTGETDVQNKTPVATVAEKEPIEVYCGAGMRVPMEEIGDAFEEKTGVPVTYNFAGSGHLLTQMELTKKGDIYLPGATLYFQKAKDKGFIVDEAKIAYHVPVIVTPKGNPAGIESLENLTRPDTRIVLGDPEAAPLGIICNKIFTKAGIKEEVDKNIVGRRPTVNELVTDVTLGQVDASIIWEDLYNPEKMEIIYIPNKKNVIKVVPVGTLTFSTQPEVAKEFKEFVESDEGGKAIFAKHGFTTYPNDKYEN